MSPEEAEFVDRLGLFMELLGGPRTMGRVYGWLLICDPPQQSLTELCADAVGQLRGLGQHRRPPASGRRRLIGSGCRAPTRQHPVPRHARAGSASLLDSAQPSRMTKLGIDAADFRALAAGQGPRAEQRERLEDFRDFCEFSARDYRDELMQRWIDYRAQEEEAMTTTKVDFSSVGWRSVEWTNLWSPCTCGHTKSRSPRPIFGDTGRCRSRRPHRLRLLKRIHRARPAVGQPVSGGAARQETR